jgi:hypothetical protein
MSMRGLPADVEDGPRSRSPTEGVSDETAAASIAASEHDEEPYATAAAEITDIRFGVRPCASIARARSARFMMAAPLGAHEPSRAGTRRWTRTAVVRKWNEFITA